MTVAHRRDQGYDMQFRFVHPFGTQVSVVFGPLALAAYQPASTSGSIAASRMPPVQPRAIAA